MSIGVATSSADLAYLIGFDDYGYGYLGPNGEIWKNSVAVGLGNPYTASAVIGVAVNWDDSEINFYANDVLQDTVSFTLGTVYPAVGVGSDDTATLRTTVAEFSYSLPSGYLAWN